MTDPQPGTPSAGALLRAAREKQGLHIAALAAAIKVSPRKLDALEADRWQDLPDATFTRALAQTVCRSLKIDAAPVLALLPPAGALPLEPIGNTHNQPFRDRPGRDGNTFGASAIKPLAWAGVALMVAAVVLYFLPAELWSPSGDAASTPVAAQDAPPPDVPTATQAPVAEPVAAATATAAPASAVALAASAVPQASAQPAGETVFSVPPAAPASAPVGAATATAAPAGVVQLSATEPSWVVARDGRGVVLLSRTVMPGESVGLDGGLPIRLTVGNAAGTQVLFRGQPVDLVPRTRENVARLELQ